jgi:hypothetical protein
MFLKHRRHVICHIIATPSATSSLQVMWQVNPWRSLLSQILGFGLGSLGFTTIYDGLKTSWITTIHDETVNTSREVICDAQSMTKWNFVIDIVLWRKLDDPLRKLTIIDHKVFVVQVQVTQCWRWNYVNLAMSLPSVLAWIFISYPLVLTPWYNKFVCACLFWSLVFMQDFSVESKTSGISSLSTSWQDLEAQYKSSNEVNMTPRSQGPIPRRWKTPRTQSKNCRILRDKELHPVRTEIDDKGPHVDQWRL